jgi:hypothetical protein
MNRTDVERRTTATDLMVMTSLWALVAVLLAAIALEPSFAAAPAVC